MEHVLKVPISRDTTDWINFATNNIFEAKKCYSKCIVDLQTNKFLETDDLVILAAVIEYFHINNSSILFIGGLGKINNFLNRIGFKRFWEIGFNRNSFNIPYGFTTVSLWQINSLHSFSYRESLTNFLKNRFLSNNIDLTSLSSNLEEIFNNIFDHSESEIKGFIIGQYFPNINKFSFSVCDLGVGIPFRVNKFKRENQLNELIDSSAIFESLKLGFTTRTTVRNRGFGLHNLLDMTESSNGELRIISNYGYVDKVAGREHTLFNFENSYLKGTLIRVDIDVNTFDEIDFSDEIMDFEYPF